MIFKFWTESLYSFLKENLYIRKKDPALLRKKINKVKLEKMQYMEKYAKFP